MFVRDKSRAILPTDPSPPLEGMLLACYCMYSEPFVFVFFQRLFNNCVLVYSDLFILLWSDKFTPIRRIYRVRRNKFLPLNRNVGLNGGARRPLRSSLRCLINAFKETKSFLCYETDEIIRVCDTRACVHIVLYCTEREASKTQNSRQTGPFNAFFFFGLASHC